MTSATWDLAALATLVTAIAGALVLLARFLSRTRDGQDQGNDLLRNVVRDIGGIRQDIRRLAQVDTDDRIRADDNHYRLWGELAQHDGRIQHIETHLGITHEDPEEDTEGDDQ